MNDSPSYLSEDTEPEEQIDPYKRLEEIISEINKKVSGIAKKYGRNPNEIYKEIGFSIDDYSEDMEKVISSAPCCRETTAICSVERYTKVIESNPVIMDCKLPPKKDISPSDIQDIIKELDSTKDVILHDIESLEQRLYELSKTKAG